MPAPRVVSNQQLELLLEFMEVHTDIAVGRSTNPKGKQELLQKWEALTLTLNSVGAMKTTVRWREYWSELKYCVRKKCAERRRRALVTDGVPFKLSCRLTALDERILAILGEEVRHGKASVHLPVNLETDMNIMKFKPVEGNHLKKGAHEECQKQNNTVSQGILGGNVGHEHLIGKPVELQKCVWFEDHCDPIIVPANEDVVSEPTEPSQHNKAMQINDAENMKTKSTNTPKRKKKKDTFIQESNHNESSTDNYSVATTSSHKCPAAEESTDLDTAIMNEKFKEHMQKGALMAVSRDPELLMGIPKHSQFCLEHLQDITELSLLEIAMTLRKIRWCESNSMIAFQSGLSESLLCEYFNKSIPKIATCMKELIITPSTDDIRNNLPILFRHQQYSKVTSIIDCYEVQIEKPNDATQKALTWSQYKRCNTIKYLISITPDGLIRFISEGYGGRTGDSTIFENCGFLDKLSKGSVVLTDGGFKNIAHLLNKKGCKLMRLPSVTSNTKSVTALLLATRVAAIRVHVETSIGKLRDFKLIGHHATVDSSFIRLLDDIMVIACGIVNLQNFVFNRQIYNVIKL